MAGTMSDADRQINQMMEFIMEEANEKAEEIRQKATAEYESQFQEMKRDVEKKLATEFKSKREQHKVEKLIAASKKKQAALFSVMELRDKLMNEVKVAVLKKLEGVEKNPDYPKLLVNLIVQGLIRMQEERVVIRVRKIDEPLVAKILKTAEAAFKKAVKDSTGYTPELQPLTIDSKYLPGPTAADNEETCAGGVVLVARNGRIVCKNTLDARLDIAFYQLTPQIRTMLFGLRPEPKNSFRNKPKPTHH